MRCLPFWRRFKFRQWQRGELFPGSLEFGNRWNVVMHEKPVAQPERGPGFEYPRTGKGQGSSHPTIIAHVKHRRVIRVGWMIHERDAFAGRGNDRAGIIHPARGFPASLLLIHATLGVANHAAAVAHTDGLGHAHANQAEGRFAKCHVIRAARGEFKVNEQQPFVVREQVDRGATPLIQQWNAVGQPLGGCQHGSFVVAIVELFDPLHHDVPFAAIVPETHAVHIVVGNPDGVVMAVSHRVVRMSHARQRTAGRTDDWKNKRPKFSRFEVKARQLETFPLERNLMVRQGNGLRSGNRFGRRQRDVGGQANAAEPKSKTYKRAGNHEISRAVVQTQANSNFCHEPAVATVLSFDAAPPSCQPEAMQPGSVFHFLRSITSTRRVACALVATTAFGFLVSGCAGSKNAPEWRTLPLIANGKVSPDWIHLGWGGFVVDENALRTECDPRGMGLLVYRKERFGNCQIRVVFKCKDAKSNAGVYVRIADGILEHARRPMAAFDRDATGTPSDASLAKVKAAAEHGDGPWFAVNHGYEVQIQDVNDPFHRTGAIYSLAPATAASRKSPGEWQTLIITLDGDEIIVDLDGQRVTDFDPESPEVPPQKEWYEPKRKPLRPEAGYIGLQNHDPGDVVWFQEVSVRPTPAAGME